MTKDKAITDVYHQRQDVLDQARSQAYHAVNIAMVQAYWNIGRIIVEVELAAELIREHRLLEMERKLKSADEEKK